MGMNEQAMSQEKVKIKRTLRNRLEHCDPCKKQQQELDAEEGTRRWGIKEGIVRFAG